MNPTLSLVLGVAIYLAIIFGGAFLLAWLDDKLEDRR